jgi:hypothetical protein
LAPGTNRLIFHSVDQIGLPGNGDSRVLGFMLRKLELVLEERQTSMHEDK